MAGEPLLDKPPGAVTAVLVLGPAVVMARVTRTLGRRSKVREILMEIPS